MSVLKYAEPLSAAGESLCFTTTQSNHPSSSTCDENSMRYVGWQQGNDAEFFSPDTVEFISQKVSELCEGLDPKNRKIVVPNNTICHIMSSVYHTRNPRVGDIHSNFIMPQEQDVCIMQTMIDRTIAIIFSNVRSSMRMDQNNKRLTVWDTVLGTSNRHGMVSHSKIKLKNRRPDPMLFMMHF